MRRCRLAGSLALLVALATPCSAEIVKVTAPSTTIYNSETKQSWTVKITGKRFMVYGVSKDWYLVGMTIDGTEALRWLPKAHVEVDWGETKTARVAEVIDANTLKLANGELVRFCGIKVTREGSALADRTYAWLKKRLEGREVILEYDSDFRRQHGCDSAYVYIDDQFVNRALVAHGLATVPLRYVTGEGRYAEVFGHLLGRAKEKERGIWGKSESVIGEEDADDAPRAVDEAGSEPKAAAAEAALTKTDRVRQLTDAQKAQWARNVGTRVKVASKHDKTKRDLADDDGCDDCEDEDVDVPSETTHVWTKTLSITVRNGWAFPLKGLTVEYEWFAKDISGYGNVVLHSSGEIAGIDLRPGESRELHSDPARFETRERDAGDRGGDTETGRKYYGYRITVVYRGTPVKVVTSSTKLVDFEGAGMN
jgi:endonuclease YncB( thermonuclease family)